MGKRVIILLGMMLLLAACGQQKENAEIEVDALTETANQLSEEEKNERYYRQLALQAEDTLEALDGVEDIDMNVINNETSFTVEVTLRYAENLQNADEFKQAVEKSLLTFFPEDELTVSIHDGSEGED